MLSRRSIRLTGKWKGYIFVVCILALLLFANSSPLAEGTRPQVLRSRAYRLNLAHNKDVKVQLQSLHLGTRIDLLPHNGLILTASNSEDLIRASSLIQLIDSRQKYVVKVLADFSHADVLPTARQIIDAAGVSGVGTFAEPPAGQEPGRIIVDVHDSKIVVVAPAELLSRVAAAVSELMDAGKADSTEANDAEQPTQAAADETSEPEAKTESIPVDAAVEAEKSEPGVQGAQTPQVTDVKPEATKEIVDGNDHKPEDFFQAEIFESLAEAEMKAANATNELLAVATTPSAEMAEAEADTPATDAAKEVAPVNIEPQDFFQAEMFKSLAEAEAKAKAAMDEITEAERSANEALARAIKAEQLAREKQRLATEAARLAAETKKKAIEAQKAVPPEKPAQAKTPTQAAAVAQPPKPQAKAEITPKTQPKPTAKVQDKAQPKVDASAPRESKPPVDPAAGDDPMLEALKKLVAKGAAAETTKADAEVDGTRAEADKGKAKTAVADKVVLPVPPTPKPKTARTPPGVTATDKIATEAPSKIAPTLPDANKEVQTTMTLPEKVEITALIELVGKQLGINYMYDPKLVTGEVFLKIHDGRIKVKDMYALLESVLQFKGFVMTRRVNLVTIRQAKDAALLDSVIRADSDHIQPGDIIVMTVFKLKHISTATAQAMLQNMNLGLSFNPIEETKTLIVTGYAYRMARMEEMLKMVDVPGKERNFRSRKLEYLLPSELAEKVKALAEQLGTISITVSKQPVRTPARPTPIRPAPRTVRKPTPPRTPTTLPKAAADKGVYLDTDDRTNRVLMIGLEEDLETVDMLIDSLDVARYGLKSVKEYAMQFVEATEIVNTLAELGVITSMPRSTMTSRTPTTRTPTTRTPTTRTPTNYGAARPVEGEPQISVRLTTNSLLVNATPEQHAEIEMLIRFVDVEQKDIRTVQEYEIQYVDITEVVETLSELGIVEQRSSSGRTGGYTSPSSRTRTGARTPATTGAATPQAPSTLTFEPTTGAEITSEQPQIAVLESTNSLLVYATPKQHDTISLIVAHVDRELADILTPYVVYALENQVPGELAATLNEIIQATFKDAAKSPTSKVQTAGTTTTGGIPPKREKNEIQIVADDKSYSLIVYADKKNQQWISALIDELDAYRPQVHLDVTLVEISQDDQFNYDLDLVTKLPNMALGGSMESGGLVTALVEPFLGSAFEASVSDGSGIAFYSDKHVQTLLELLDKKNYGRVLARPSLLVKDNQLGEIKAEKTIYVAQEKSSIVPTTATTQQTVTDVTFLPYTSGVTLSITPHIASDNILQLEIMLDRTDFVPDTGTTVIRGETFPKPLDTVASNLATWAVLPNGATIILGGIESITQSKAIRKVPLLGDLPIIGALFRGVDETDVQSKLYVFVKATIIRPGEELTGVSDIEVLSRKKREAFEEDEVKFQRLEGVIPGVTPPPLDPIKILEDDEYIRELKNRLHKDEKVSVKVKLDDAY